MLLQPATLTLPRPSGPGHVVGFGFDGSGDGFHLVPHRVAGDTVQLKVWHFSGAGVLPARLDELATALSYEPTPAHELAEQRIAAALVDAQVERHAIPAPAIAVALRNWRSSSVSQGLQIAGTTTRLDFFELAFGEWLAWLAYLQEYRDTHLARRQQLLRHCRAPSTERSRPTPPPRSPAASSRVASAPTSPALPSAT